MQELLDELTPDGGNTILALNPKIMFRVRLSDIFVERTFISAYEAENFINQEHIWERSLRCKSKGDIIQNYFCRIYQCPATLCLRYYNNSEKVSISRTLARHTHELGDTRNPFSIKEITKNTNQLCPDSGIKGEKIIFDQVDELTSHMIFDKKFSSLTAARQYIHDADTWNIVSSVEITSLTITNFRCNLVAKNGHFCPMKISLLFDSKQALLYRNSSLHNHYSHNQITKNELKIKVLDEAEENESHLPSFDTMEMWLSSITQVPRDNNSVFCVDFFLDRKENTLRFFLSTRQLLKTALESSSIHISSLYSVLWNKYEVILVGTTDLNKKFHHFGVAVCSAKTAVDYEFIFSSLKKGVTECYPDANLTINTLLSDCNPAVQHAFKYVFGCTSKTITCLSDFTFNISNLFRNDNCGGILDDILKLQKLPTTDVFLTGAELFLEKWSSEMEEIELFKKQWLDQNCNWYKGYSYFTPSENSAVLNEYDIFRTTYLKNPCESLDLFMEQLFLALKNWSNSYNNGNWYAKKTTISSELIYEAVRWLRLPKNIEKDKTDTETLYFFNVDRGARFDRDLFKIYRGHQFSTFDDFIAVRSKYHTVRKNNANLIYCECTGFVDNFACVHSIGVAFLLNLYEIPNSIIPDPSTIPYYLNLG